MLHHHGASLSKHCAAYGHGTQTTDSNGVRDRLRSVRAAIMATHAWTKLAHMHGPSKPYNLCMAKQIMS